MPSENEEPRNPGSGESAPAEAKQPKPPKEPTEEEKRELARQAASREAALALEKQATIVGTYDLRRAGHLMAQAAKCWDEGADAEAADQARKVAEKWAPPVKEDEKQG